MEFYQVLLWHQVVKPFCPEIFLCWIEVLNLDVTLHWTFVNVHRPHCPRAWMITGEISHIASSALTGDVSALLNPQCIWTQCDEGLGVSACGLRKWLSLAQLFCGLLFSCCFHFSPSLTRLTENERCDWTRSLPL